MEEARNVHGVLLSFDSLTELNGFLRAKNLGLGFGETFHDPGEVLVDPLLVLGVEVLEHAGDVAPLTTQQFAGVWLLHGLDLVRIQVVNLDAGEGVESGTEFRQAGGCDEKQAVGQRRREQLQRAFFDDPGADVVEVFLQVGSDDSALLILNFEAAVLAGTNPETQMAAGAVGQSEIQTN